MGRPAWSTMARRSWGVRAAGISGDGGVQARVWRADRPNLDVPGSRGSGMRPGVWGQSSLEEGGHRRGEVCLVSEPVEHCFGRTLEADVVGGATMPMAV